MVDTFKLFNFFGEPEEKPKEKPKHNPEKTLRKLKFGEKKQDWDIVVFDDLSIGFTGESGVRVSGCRPYYRIEEK